MTTTTALAPPCGSRPASTTALFAALFSLLLFASPTSADEISLRPESPTSADTLVAEYFACRSYTPISVVSSVHRDGARIEIRAFTDGGFAVGGCITEDIEIGRLPPGEYTVELWSKAYWGEEYELFSQLPVSVAPAAVPLGGLGGLIALAGALVGAGIGATRRRSPERRL